MSETVHHFDLPYGALPPALLNHGLGIARVVARSDERDATVDVTVLDTPDHRLLRAGVLLAHRVAEGRGSWYLAAPTWVPLLPAEESLELDGNEDLPPQLAARVRPFKRRGVLGPVAALEIKRSGYELRGEGGATLATLHDERVTVRRGGLTTARYREVTLVATDAATDEQVAWVREAIELIGGAATIGFPSLTARLGAPATGLSDLPTARVASKRDPLELFVAGRLADRLRALVAADLALAEDDEGTATIRRELERLRRDLDGLSGVLEPQWRRDLAEDVDWLLERDPDDAGALLGERYLGVLEALVPAARNPRLGALGKRSAREVLGEELRAAVATFRSRAEGLDVDGFDSAWTETLGTAGRVVALTGVARDVLGSTAREIRDAAKRLQAGLEECVVVSTAVDEAALAAMSPQEAFDAGRVFERDVTAQRAARADFVRTWERHAKKLGSTKLGA